MTVPFDLSTFTPDRFALRSVPEDRIRSIITFFEFSCHQLHKVAGGYIKVSNIRINPGSVVADIEYGVKNPKGSWSEQERGNTYLKELFSRFLAAEQRRIQREKDGTNKTMKISATMPGVG